MTASVRKHCHSREHHPRAVHSRIVTEGRRMPRELRNNLAPIALGICPVPPGLDVQSPVEDIGVSSNYNSLTSTNPHLNRYTRSFGRHSSSPSSLNHPPASSYRLDRTVLCRLDSTRLFRFRDCVRTLTLRPGVRLVRLMRQVGRGMACDPSFPATRRTDSRYRIEDALRPLQSRKYAVA
jgi:hypothetical protein